MKTVGVDYLCTDEAQRYDEMHQRFRDYEEISRSIIDSLGIGPESTVIDIGAGTGAFAIAAAKYYKYVYAVDISEAMIDQCRQKANAAGLDNVICQVGGFLTYEHDSDPVDAIISLIVLHHLPDFWKLEALKRIAGMLKSGGQFLLFDIVLPSETSDLGTQIDDWIKTIGKLAGPELAAEAEIHIRDEYSTYDWIMEGLLVRAGFTIDSAEYNEFNATYICIKG